MVCRDFILPEFCKPCLFLSSFQFAKIIIPYRPEIIDITVFLKSSVSPFAPEKDAPQENCEASFFINKPQSFVNYFGSWNDKRTVLLIGLNIRGFRHGFDNASGRIGYINRDLRSVCAMHHISVQVYIYTLGPRSGTAIGIYGRPAVI